jgi:hypothetical protein
MVFKLLEGEQMKAYTCKRDKDTNELHLFEGDMKPHDKQYSCTSKSSSVCKKMAKTQSAENIFTCKDEQEAREECAGLGRHVCGTCVSHLYASY